MQITEETPGQLLIQAVYAEEKEIISQLQKRKSTSVHIQDISSPNQQLNWQLFAAEYVQADLPIESLQMTPTTTGEVGFKDSICNILSRSKTLKILTVKCPLANENFLFELRVALKNNPDNSLENLNIAPGRHHYEDDLIWNIQTEAIRIFLALKKEAKNFKDIERKCYTNLTIDTDELKKFQEQWNKRFEASSINAYKRYPDFEFPRALVSLFDEITKATNHLMTAVDSLVKADRVRDIFLKSSNDIADLSQFYGTSIPPEEIDLLLEGADLIGDEQFKKRLKNLGLKWSSAWKTCLGLAIKSLRTDLYLFCIDTWGSLAFDYPSAAHRLANFYFNSSSEKEDGKIKRREDLVSACFYMALAACGPSAVQYDVLRFCTELFNNTFKERQGYELPYERDELYQKIIEKIHEEDRMLAVRRKAGATKEETKHTEDFTIFIYIGLLLEITTPSKNQREVEMSAHLARYLHYLLKESPFDSNFTGILHGLDRCIGTWIRKLYPGDYGMDETMEASFKHFYKLIWYWRQAQFCRDQKEKAIYFCLALQHILNIDLSINACHSAMNDILIVFMDKFISQWSPKIFPIAEFPWTQKLSEKGIGAFSQHISRKAAMTYLNFTGLKESLSKMMTTSYKSVFWEEQPKVSADKQKIQAGQSKSTSNQSNNFSESEDNYRIRASHQLLEINPNFDDLADADSSSGNRFH